MAKLDYSLEENIISELAITLGTCSVTSVEELDGLWSGESDPNMVVEGVPLARVALAKFVTEQYLWYLSLHPKCLYDRSHIDRLFQYLPMRGTTITSTPCTT